MCQQMLYRLRVGLLNRFLNMITNIPPPSPLGVSFQCYQSSQQSCTLICSNVAKARKSLNRIEVQGCSVLPPQSSETMTSLFSVSGELSRSFIHVHLQFFLFFDVGKTPFMLAYYHSQGFDPLSCLQLFQIVSKSGSDRTYVKTAVKSRGKRGKERAELMLKGISLPSKNK